MITGRHDNSNALINNRSYGTVEGRTESAAKTHVGHTGRSCLAAVCNVLKPSNDAVAVVEPRAIEDLDCAQFTILRNAIIGATRGSRNMRPVDIMEIKIERGEDIRYLLFSELSYHGVQKHLPMTMPINQGVAFIDQVCLATGRAKHASELGVISLY